MALSAKAIEAHIQLEQPGHPGLALWVSALLFMKTAKLNMAGRGNVGSGPSRSSEPFSCCARWKFHGALLILWFVSFHAYSRRLGSVPFFGARLVAALLLERVSVRTRTFPGSFVFLAIAITFPSSWSAQGRALRHNRSLPPIDWEEYFTVARNTHLPSRSPRQLCRPYRLKTPAAELRKFPRILHLLCSPENTWARSSATDPPPSCHLGSHPSRLGLGPVAPAQYADYVVTAKGNHSPMPSAFFRGP